MLVFGAVAGHEPDLTQGVFETVSFGGLGVLLVAFEIPVCVLRDLGDDETTGDGRNPIGELETARFGVELVRVRKVLVRVYTFCDGAVGFRFFCLANRDDDAF